MKAMGMTLREGRTFTGAETATTPFVVIVNETMARRVLAGCVRDRQAAR